MKERGSKIGNADLLEPEEKYRIIWEELNSMNAAHFRFGEKSQPADFTSSVSASMHEDYPPDWILSGPILTREVLVSICTAANTFAFSLISMPSHIALAS